MERVIRKQRILHKSSSSEHVQSATQRRKKEKAMTKIDISSKRHWVILADVCVSACVVEIPPRRRPCTTRRHRRYLACYHRTSLLLSTFSHMSSPNSSSSTTSRRRHSLQRQASPSTTTTTMAASSPLIMLGLLMCALAIITLYSHSSHLAEVHEQETKYSFESTTYHSSQKLRKHKRIHRTKDGEEVVEIVQDEPRARNEEAVVVDTDTEEEEEKTPSKQDTDTDSKQQQEAAAAPQLRTNDDTNDNWPSPRLTEEKTVIMVMSARSHLEIRQTIRETWGNGHDNIYFIIGQYCPVNQAHRKDQLTCENMPLSSSTKKKQSQKQHDEWYAKRMKLESQVLREEQEHYRDMLWTPSPESYRGLPHKLKEAYHWIVRNLPNTQWIVKADDDTIVRVKSLGTYLDKLSYTKPTVIGNIEYEGLVHKDGKWREVNYPKDRYPPFPLGSCGHAVSRPVAQYVSKYKSSLQEYQGEDTSLAIWMDESPLEVDFYFSESFVNDGMCENPNSFVIGHDLTVDRIRECFAIGDEVQPISVKQF